MLQFFLVHTVSTNAKEDTHKMGKSKHSKQEKKETEKDYEKKEHGKKGIRK